MVAALHFRRLPERDDRGAAALLALLMDANVVVAHIERSRLGREPSTVQRVEEGGDEKRLVLARRPDLPGER